MTFYVNMVDRFMSGWGLAKGGSSRYSIRCETLEQAEAIEKAARDRGEMRYINIALQPPRTRRGDHLKLVEFDEVSGPWKAYWRG